jgi:response regulator NasT
MVRVLVIAESSGHADIIRAGLSLAGYEPTGVLLPNSDFQEAFDQYHPDAVVLESQSPDSDLLDRVLEAMGENPRPLVIFADDASTQTIDRIVKAGAGACVVDGLVAHRVPAIMQVAIARFDYVAKLRHQLGAAQHKLAERKFVERAKGLLMKTRNLSEDEAYHTLRRMAMERNRRMGDVARSVIEMADLLN